MLIREGTLAGVRAGTIDRQYRRWTRPTVKAGGTLTTSVGVLDVRDVQIVDPAQISDEDALRAGSPSREALLAELDGGRPRAVRGRPATSREGGQVYCVQIAWRGEDPRIALRQDLSEPALADVRTRLARLDARGPWTRAVLAAIAAEPGRRAPELAEGFGMETLAFKAQVRKLKALGLTESLAVGYRLSPRGLAVLGEGT